MDPTPSIEDKIREKAEHLKKYFKGDLDVEWTCCIEDGRHQSKIAVHAGHNYFHSEATDDDLYHTFDQALKKVEKQIREKHNQLKDHLHKH